MYSVHLMTAYYSSQILRSSRSAFIALLISVMTSVMDPDEKVLVSSVYILCYFSELYKGYYYKLRREVAPNKILEASHIAYLLASTRDHSLCNIVFCYLNIVKTISFTCLEFHNR